MGTCLNTGVVILFTPVSRSKNIERVETERTINLNGNVKDESIREFGVVIYEPTVVMETYKEVSSAMLSLRGIFVRV